MTENSLPRLLARLDNFGYFQRFGQSYWSQIVFCEICLESHTLCSLKVQSCEAATEPPLTGAVRLADGLFQVDITFEPACLPQPFQNTAKMLASYLGIPIVSDHQIFDSINHLAHSLQFSISGTFLGWDEAEITDYEAYAIELGHLMKFRFQPQGDSGLLDIALEFEESSHFESNYLGAKAVLHGIEITISGGESSRVDMARTLFQEALDDYAWLLRKVSVQADNPTNQMSCTDDRLCM